jgi:hypothetical protein
VVNEFVWEQSGEFHLLPSSGSGAKPLATVVGISVFINPFEIAIADPPFI